MFLRRSLLAAAAMLAVGMWSVEASAQCASDAECKGARICHQGSCITPGAPARAPAPVQLSTSPALAPHGSYGPSDTGWAMAAGIMGCVTGALVLAVGIGIEANLRTIEKGVAIGMGATATVATGVMGPVVAVGAASARRGGARGSVVLQVIGWITYGVFMVDALAAIALGIADVRTPDGMSVGLGLSGALSLSMFSADAFISYSQARRSVRLGSAPAPLLTLAPTVAPVVGAPGDSSARGGLVGVAGAF